MLRYGGTIYDNPYKELSVLHQAGTVEEYIDTFELISAQVPRLFEGQYLRYFMGGLCSDLRHRVRSFHPNSRWKAMQIARDMEREIDGVLVSSEVVAYRARMGKITVGRSFRSGTIRKAHEGFVSTNPIKPSPNLSGTTLFGQGGAFAFSSSSWKAPASSNNVSMPRRWDNDRRTSTKRAKGTRHLSY